MALHHVDSRSSSALLLATPHTTPEVRENFGDPVELVCHGCETDAVNQVESAIHEHRPFTLVFIDARLLHGKDYRSILRRLWQLQRDLFVVLYAASQLESVEQLPVELGHPRQLLVLNPQLAPFEVAQLIRTFAAKHASDDKSMYRDLDLRAELLEAVRKYEDVSSRLRTEQDLRSQLEEKLRRKQRMETLGRFTDAMTHFFNNYLTVLQGRLSLASAAAVEHPALRNSLDDLLVTTKRASNVTAQFVAVNRREYLHPQPTNVAQLIDSQAQLLKQVMGESITLEVSHWADLPLVEADPACLEQCLFNLLVHSREAMPKGGKLTIQTRRHQIADSDAAAQTHPEAKPGSHVLISIADTGGGMSPAEVGRLLDSNTILQDSEEKGNIALILVQSMLRLQGGWLAVDSVPDTGTEFRIYLPASEAAEAAPPAEKQPLDLTTAQESSTILIVDDEESVRQVMEYVLTSQGHNVLIASDSNEAWRLWRSRASVIKLVITDIQLPGGANGFDLEKAIKESDPTMPVIFTCGYCPSKISNAKELQVGENFLPKPFGMVELLNIVGQALQRSVKF